MLNILLIGSGAREHAIAKAIKRSQHISNLFCFAANNNPGIVELSKDYIIGDLKNSNLISQYAEQQNIDFAIIGPEAALAAGVVDDLAKINIPSVGPTKKLAQIETSKGFARNLLDKNNILASPKYKVFKELAGAEEFLKQLADNYVIKADGLKGGKGVKISGEHLFNHDDALNYCKELIAQGSAFVIEEKLTGQEFSLLSFSDGKHLLHMPPVRDYKRAFVNNTGPNTGGMGSYSAADHLLPFLTQADIYKAQEINLKTILAILKEFKTPYKGILYGGFIATNQGIKLIEYNARFGDPEAINLLALLETDFIDICQAIINDALNQIQIKFSNKATVCKYLVPEGYPNSPKINQEIDVSNIDNKQQLYYAAVNAKDNKLYTTSSRTLAILGIGDTIKEAEQQAEAMAKKVKGPIFYRQDIGINL